MNEKFPVGIYLPLWDSTTKHYCICRVVPEESKVLNSRDRVPFILTFEAIESTEQAISNFLHLHAHNTANAIIEFAKTQESHELHPPSDSHTCK